MEDKLGFESLMEEMRSVQACLQIYGPLSPASLDRWDSVDSSGYSEEKSD